jgi:membrane fusion protein (multidrug efflux system)
MKVVFRLVLGLVAIAAALWWLGPAREPLEHLIAAARTLVGAPAAPGTPAAAPAGKPPGGFAMPVEAGPVKIGTVTRRISSVGSLLSSESVVIRPEIAGRITEIAFAEGQPVTKGQVLVRIDDAVQRAILAETQAGLNLSRIEANRAEELFRQGTGSAKNRDQTQSKLLFDQSEVAVAQARLAKLTLSAPFDGVLGLRKVSLGDYVREGQDMVNLEAIDALKVDFQVPEQFLTAVSVGQSLVIAVDAFPGRTFEGKVFAIDPLVDVNGRFIKIRARIDNPQRTLRPGVFARVTLTLTTRSDAILVPEQALFAIGNDQFVFRIADGVAHQVRVRTGERRDAEVEIVEGLKPDDLVVWSGQLKLREGVPVMNISKPAAGG